MYFIVFVIIINVTLISLNINCVLLCKPLESPWKKILKKQIKDTSGPNLTKAKNSMYVENKV